VNTGTTERRAMDTSAEGGYRFVNLIPGTYRLQVEKSGFKRYTRDQMEAAVRIDVAMQVGDMAQPVVMEATAALTASPNSFIFGGGLRPNVASGCKKEVPGSAQSKYLQWFNTACFSFPAAYTCGSESRTDPQLRGPGIANYDFALYKKNAITERYNFEIRAETFNPFNRVQFGTPNTVFTTASTSTFGQITTQLNQPHPIQVAMRLRF